MVRPRSPRYSASRPSAAISSSVAASAGQVKTSPGKGARPRGRNATAAAGSAASFGAASRHCRATTSATGNPSRAQPIAGASACRRGSVPCSASSSDQPSTAPGTVTDNTPWSGIDVCPSSRSRSRLAAWGEHPLAFSPRVRPLAASCTIANRSPPTPVIVGSTTDRTAAAVTAASIALPPFLNTSSPAAEASGWLVAMRPVRPRATEREPRAVVVGAPGGRAFIGLRARRPETGRGGVRARRGSDGPTCRRASGAPAVDTRPSRRRRW